MPTFTIKPLGPFSLEELAIFGFGQRSEQKWDGVMRLDDFTGHVGVEVRQDDGLALFLGSTLAGVGPIEHQRVSPLGPVDDLGRDI
jgi:hypothetical protein